MLKQIESVNVEPINKANLACYINQSNEELPSDVVLIGECLEAVTDTKLKLMLSLCLQSYIHYELGENND